MHLQQQHLVQHLPEQKHNKSINAAIAIFIKANKPNTALVPNFPYSSIVCELSAIIPVI
jgi:hypothetical protein